MGRGPVGGYGPDVRARALELVAAGKNGPQVARECGVSLPTVQRWAREAGLTLPRNPSPAHPWKSHYGKPLSYPRRPKP